MPEPRGQASQSILVRVSPEILERMKVGDVEPVVILGVQEHDDGTYDMTLQIPETSVQLARYREALEWIADDVDEGEMRKWARQALAGEPLTGPGQP